MRRKGARKKSSLNAAKGSMFSESTTETKKGKLTGGSGRYFSKKIDEVEDDDKVNLNDAVDGSDESNSDDVERQSNVEVGKDQENAGDDEDTGTDDDAGSKENGIVKHSGHITRNNNDKNESGSGGSNDEEDAGNSNESGSESEEDEDESDSGSEEDEESEENSEAETVPSKRKKLNKQLNVSSLSKKGMKLIQKLPKFRGTTKASEQNQQADSPSKKRKKCNDDEEVENQISPAKESHANRADSPSKKRKKPYDDDEVENKISPAKKSHADRADSPRKKRKKPYNDDEVENQISPAKKPRGFDVETEYSVVIRKEERNVRSLFLKDLPPNTTVEMVKKLSPEIINVHIPLERNKKVKSVYAFIEFESEEAAERNYRNIKEKTIDNKKITVDYCGAKSNHYRKEQKEFPVNLRRLFIPSVPMDVTADELKQCFPDAKSLTTKQRGSKRLAFMSFENEAIAKKVFEESGKLTLHGKKITVVFAYKKKRRPATVNSRKRAKIVFDDGGLLNVVKAETKDESKNVSESMETTKEVKKQKRKKKKNPKIKTT